MLTGLSFDNMYQMGFLVGDVERAVARFGREYGVARFRIKQHSPTIATAHAYVGAVMIELLQTPKGGSPIYDDYIPSDPDGVRFHHHAYRIEDDSKWNGLLQTLESGNATYVKTMAMNGGLNAVMIDLRQAIGTFVEYVYLTGEATHYYDDVPHN